MCSLLRNITDYSNITLQCHWMYSLKFCPWYKLMSVKIGEMSFIQTAFFSGKLKNNKTKEVKSKKKKNKRKKKGKSTTQGNMIQKIGFFLKNCTVGVSLFKKLNCCLSLEKRSSNRWPWKDLVKSLGFWPRITSVSLRNSHLLISKPTYLPCLTGQNPRSWDLPDFWRKVTVEAAHNGYCD